MNSVIVVTELSLLPPSERWAKLVSPLQQELNASGLGRLLNFELIEQETSLFGSCAVEEVAVELTHLHYGRDLVSRMIQNLGLPQRQIITPARWRSYQCDDYFCSEFSATGYFDHDSQTPVVVPCADAYENTEQQFLVIGHSGVGGIDFGYRYGMPGVWASSPIDGEFTFIAGTVSELVEIWCSGKLSV